MEDGATFNRNSTAVNGQGATRGQSVDPAAV
jgi:hypothetical protein